jgi:hypothetical protein
MSKHDRDEIAFRRRRSCTNWCTSWRITKSVASGEISEEEEVSRIKSYSSFEKFCGNSSPRARSSVLPSPPGAQGRAQTELISNLIVNSFLKLAHQRLDSMRRKLEQGNLGILVCK